MGNVTLSRLKIDKTVVIVALLGPALWIFDSFSNAVVFNENFIRQLFLPKSGDLGLRLWLVFFTTLAAFFWARYTALRSRVAGIAETRDAMFDALQDAAVITDVAGRIIKINIRAQAVLGYAQDELFARELTQVCPEAESEKFSGFIKDVLQQGQGFLSGAKVCAKDKKEVFVDVKAFVLGDTDAQDRQTVFFDLAERSAAGAVAEAATAPAVQDYERKLDQMRTKIEGEVAEKERARVEILVKEMEARQAETVARKVAEGRSQIEETVRQEEQQKAREELKAIEKKIAQAARAAAPPADEQAIRNDERVKAEQRIAQLREELARELDVQVGDARRQTEEKVRLEEEAWVKERISILEKQQAAAMKAQAEDVQRRTEETVRRDEQAKTAEALDALRASLKQEYEMRLEQERQFIEAGVREQEQEKARLMMNQAEAQYTEKMKNWLQETRQAMEEAVRQEERAKLQQRISELEQAQPAPAQVPAVSQVIKGLNSQIAAPLGSVLNNLKLIKIKLVQGSDVKPKDFKDAVLAIEENAVLCKNIMYSMVDPSSVGKVTLQPVSLNDVIAKLDGLFGQELKLQSIVISKQLQATLPEVQADSTLLLQALFNIFSNAKWAIKASPYSVGGAITITTKASDDKKSVRLDIADNGIGIPEANVSRVFEPFFTTKKEGEGLGLGLTVARNIIRAHNGDIRIQSTENKGTVVSITLPAAEDAKT